MQLINKHTPWYKRLKLLRIAAGLTQMELAAKMGMQHRNYWGWEKGLNVPNEQHQDEIAAVLGVTRQAIFGDDPRRKEADDASDH
jgi:transcriptional regulator with XRE-family HTH domain